ncbi:catechol 1,2-dioxygenase [Pseudomonas sp. MTM4]|uniref:catechol 1,2-dioxygenase n=1 Tax=unclassified Pseudomonas TaxID=196821 RepID=UPI0018D22426|nr:MULTISPECIES: catechol 1,2-dioxygenase [unclassified Pseudomonas]MBC8649315.1 catechol 1,2-dioxygenase [Pseudomonas sp. MT4]QXY90664.1 catechol 1,2-dioxygenase [Pseudomonas sp. MTM4]
MTTRISHQPEIQQFFHQAAGLDNAGGNTRNKEIVLRILQETARIIEDLQITDDEFWAGVSYLNRLGGSNEAGLLVAGLGVEHFLDLLADARDEASGVSGGTPRTIEGPLYVAGAPLSEGEVRMDDGSEDDVATVMFLEGRVLDLQGNPIAGATVDLWQADTKGNYSYFDKSQSDFNLRRRILTDAEGRYRARSIVPSGYGCDPAGPTQACLDQLGRHGQRPAHVHFFISAPGFEHLTTQINLSNDDHLWDDFAYATRDGLIGEIRFIEDPAQSAQRNVEGRFAEMNFDFQLRPARSEQATQRSQRPRALQD